MTFVCWLRFGVEECGVIGKAECVGGVGGVGEESEHVGTGRSRVDY